MFSGATPLSWADSLDSSGAEFYPDWFFCSLLMDIMKLLEHFSSSQPLFGYSWAEILVAIVHCTF